MLATLSLPPYPSHPSPAYSTISEVVNNLCIDLLITLYPLPPLSLQLSVPVNLLTASVPRTVRKDAVLVYVVDVLETSASVETSVNAPKTAVKTVPSHHRECPLLTHVLQYHKSVLHGKTCIYSTLIMLQDFMMYNADCHFVCYMLIFKIS